MLKLKAKSSCHAQTIFCHRKENGLIFCGQFGQAQALFFVNLG